HRYTRCQLRIQCLAFAKPRCTIEHWPDVIGGNRSLAVQRFARNRHYPTYIILADFGYQSMMLHDGQCTDRQRFSSQMQDVYGLLGYLLYHPFRTVFEHYKRMYGDRLQTADFD